MHQNRERLGSRKEQKVGGLFVGQEGVQQICDISDRPLVPFAILLHERPTRPPLQKENCFEPQVAEQAKWLRVREKMAA